MSLVVLQVEVRGIDGELKQLAEECITIRPNFSYTLQEIQENAMRVFSTNYFRSLSPRTKVTQDGVKLIFNVSFPFSLDSCLLLMLEVIHTR